jgi:hypothetical protein
VEHLYAEAKDHHGLGRARVRGLAKVDTQVKLTAAVQNLKRLLNSRPNRRGASALHAEQAISLLFTTRRRQRIRFWSVRRRAVPISRRQRPPKHSLFIRLLTVVPPLLAPNQTMASNLTIPTMPSTCFTA